MLKTVKTFSSFSVDDLEKAQAFYKDVLGIEAEEKPEGLEVANGVFVYPKENHTPALFTVLNFIVEDIESAVDELTQKGAAFEQYPEFNTDEKGIAHNDGTYPGPAAIAWFKDPAGNVFSLIQA